MDWSQLAVEFRVLGQALLALALGGIVGWERQQAGKWAGLRTHMLICMSSALIVGIGQLLVTDSEPFIPPGALRSDPIRLILTIVTALGFIGAGVVFRDESGHRAEGLTTAAALLATSTVGAAVAIGRYIVAVGATFLIWFVLAVIRRLEGAIDVEPRQKPNSEFD